MAWPAILISMFGSLATALRQAAAIANALSRFVVRCRRLPFRGELWSVEAASHRCHANARRHSSANAQPADSESDSLVAERLGDVGSGRRNPRIFSGR